MINLPESILKKYYNLWPEKFKKIHVKELHEDSNGHAVDDKGKLVEDMRCSYCRACKQQTYGTQK